MLAHRRYEEDKRLKRIAYYLCGFFLAGSMALFFTGCSQDSSNQAQGYIEGKYTYVATSVSGVMIKRFVNRGDRVDKDQALFMLESQPESDEYQAALTTLQGSIAARDALTANLAYAKLTYERNQVLVQKRAIQQSELDRAKSDFDALTAQLIQANMQIATDTASTAAAKWTKNQKNIVAPIKGLVFNTYYRVGEYVEADQAVLSLIAPIDIKLIFYVSETALGQLQLQDKVTVACDSCKKKYTGKISFISPSAEYTPPVIYSNETNEKLIYRIEANFSPEDAMQLHPGQPVYVTYYPHA